MNDDAAERGEWVLVPREPTREMIEASAYSRIARRVYRTMVAAAPPPPVQGDVTVKPLEWRKQNLDGTVWTSEVSICGEFYVRFDGNEWIGGKNLRVIARAKSSSDAIADVSAYYEQRIRSALIEPAPAPVGAGLQDMTQRIKKLEDALRFYADVSKYPAPLTDGMGELWADCGEVARAALAHLGVPDLSKQEG
jgi:hypothetical protein